MDGACKLDNVAGLVLEEGDDSLNLEYQWSKGSIEHLPDAVRTEEIKSLMRLGVFEVVDEKDYHDNASFSVGRDRCDRDVGLRSNSGSKRLGRHGGGLRRWCLP